MSEEKEIPVTDIEDFDEVDVIEVLVAEGDMVEANQSIVTLESDKAMMEYPIKEAGKVKRLQVAVGDKVKQGDVLLVLEVEQSSSFPAQSTPPEDDPATHPPGSEAIESEVSRHNEPEKDAQDTTPVQAEAKARPPGTHDSAYASPVVRKYAKELGINIEHISGSADKGRILKQDVQKYVQQTVARGGRDALAGVADLPDFKQFGETQETALNKLKQVSAKHLTQAWTQIPHVTQFDDADITELEKIRKQLKQETQQQGIKLTLLPFVMKAMVSCLQEYPDFNSSINADTTALIHKKYFHLGIAVDTPRGLVVPVIRDVEQKKISELAEELMQTSERAREGKLTPKEMQGGCMTITSLGGVGGRYFTPIINFPEVAILGLSRSYTQLVKQGDNIQETLMLPLSLSYDHRAIDGVAGVKFTTMLKEKLSDVWSLLI